MSKTTISEMEFIEVFSSEDKALKFFEMHRWRDGRYCPCCGSKDTYSHKTKKHFYHCREPKCRKQFTCKTNTVMHASNLPVKIWLYAMYKLTVSRKGISSLQMDRELGITQKSSWFMMQRLKEACVHNNKKTNQGRGTVGKTAVLGMRQRDGRVIAKPVSKTDKETLKKEIVENVEQGSVICTDEPRSYPGLKHLRYNHKTVKHSIGEYVEGDMHTNSIESVWELFKR